MCEEFRPGRFSPEEPILPVVNSPHKQNVFEDKQAEPGSVESCSKKVEEFPDQALPDENKPSQIAHTKYFSGATQSFSYEVENSRMLGSDRHWSKSNFILIEISLSDR